MKSFSCGTNVKVCEGSGCDSGEIGVIIHRSEVKCDHNGIPNIGGGHYSTVDWRKESAIRYKNGRIGTMFNNRLIKVD
jgi:hypothetical protein